MSGILYLSLTGMTEPLGRSQVLEYLIDLSKDNRICLVSFERDSDSDSRETIDHLVSDADINWNPLHYTNKFGSISSVMQIIAGMKAGAKCIRHNQVDVIHARSMIPALMGLYLKLRYKKKLLFDIRGFSTDEKVDRGRIRKNSIIYRVLKHLEDTLYRKADNIVTLTHASKKILSKFYNISDDRIDVIPTCVNGKLFQRLSVDASAEFKHSLGYSMNDQIIIHTGNVTGWYLFEDEVRIVRGMMALDDRIHFLVLNRDQHQQSRDILTHTGIDEKRYRIMQAEFEDVHRYLSISTAAIYFIKPVFSKKASAPTKFAEMVSCHVPSIVNTGVGDMDDYIEHYHVGLAFNLRDIVDSPHETAKSVIEYLNSDPENLHKNEYDRLFQSCFDKNIAINKYREIYRHLSS